MTGMKYLQHLSSNVSKELSGRLQIELCKVWTQSLGPLFSIDELVARSSNDELMIDVLVLSFELGIIDIPAIGRTLAVTNKSSSVNYICSGKAYGLTQEAYVKWLRELLRRLCCHFETGQQMLNDHITVFPDADVIGNYRKDLSAELYAVIVSASSRLGSM
jgi:hypothetical protein